MRFGEYPKENERSVFRGSITVPCKAAKKRKKSAASADTGGAVFTKFRAHGCLPSYGEIR
ncbi:MAG TPA: hypothetical protein DCE65_07155 [Clostridiales bacterium]|nr:hypothetical protein [Clostridiales bacterium]